MRSCRRTKFQAGFTAMVMVLVISLATAAAVFARVTYLRGTQDVALLLKKGTTTQAKAWRAADALRIALGDMTAEYVEALAANAVIPITMSDSTGYSISARVMRNDSLAGGARELTMRVVAKTPQSKQTPAVLPQYW